MTRICAVYMLTSKHNNVIYTGVTRDLEYRLFQHQTRVFPQSFSARYQTTKLVYYEVFSSMADAIAFEKKIKSGSRSKKIKLIESLNPGRADLSLDLFRTNKP